jgi:hypothetical protein
MGIPQRACLYQCYWYTWPIVKNNLLDTEHSVLPARTARGQLFRHNFADIVTEFFKYSVRTTTKTSVFLDKHSINQHKKFQVNIFILYIFSLPLKTPETLTF